MMYKPVINLELLPNITEVWRQITLRVPALDNVLRKFNV